jgi:hypothetical protein
MKAKTPLLPKKKAFAVLKAALLEHGFKMDGDSFTYSKSSEEITVQLERGKITVIDQCFPMSEGWSISEFVATPSGIKRAVRRAKAEAGRS